MNPEHIKYLRCPECYENLGIKSGAEKENGKVKNGTIECLKCSKEYPIVNFIPRFVELDNYATGFGYQWNLHSKTQLDSQNGSKVSEERFIKETRWDLNLSNKVVLEAGSGSGRFTEHIVKTKAMTISFDYSHAVEANYRHNGHNENLLILQADIYKMPFEKHSFDKVLCIGVLQHTPDPRKSFLSLSEMIKEGGEICVDVYRKTLRNISKYWVRPFFKKTPHQKLYSIVEKYVDFMWPICTINSTLFKRVGHVMNRFMLVPDYRPVLNLPEKEMYKTWAKLDMFDAISPAYDYPQSLPDFKKWFHDANLKNIDVHYGYNGIEGRARK